MTLSPPVPAAPHLASRSYIDVLQAIVEAALIPCGLARGPAVVALDQLVALATFRGRENDLVASPTNASTHAGHGVAP